MTKIVTLTPPPAAPSARTRRTFALRDLDVAPENMRFGAPQDDEIPQLAATIKAAGVLQPLTVRPGRRREKAGMALDGRRRLLALALLLEAGEITDAYEVEAFVETDLGRQAAAVLLTNTAVPVHVADVIAAIGKMLQARLTVAAMAKALGYGELEVRRLAALAGLHPDALQALKAGKITLRQARLLARMTDPEAQAEVARRTLEGLGFPEYWITERLDTGQVTPRDRRWTLVGADRYAAAGGRVESDLFGERPDVLLDPEILDRLWIARATSFSQGLARDGLRIHVTAAADPDDPEGLDPFGHGHGFGLDGDQLAAWRSARAAAADAANAASAAGPALDGADGAILAFLEAELTADAASDPDRTVTGVILCPGGPAGLRLRVYGPPAVERDPDAGPERDDDPVAELADVAPPPPAPVPVVPAAAPDLEGVNHALHEVRTDAATRALIRALADDPAAALVALLARLFDAMVCDSGRPHGGGALTVRAEAYGRPRMRVIDALDGDVRRRLADRRAVWAGSGRSPIAWIAGLAHGEKMALLAELTALSLDLREERTTAVRSGARAEAAELAALCGAEVTLHWTPDEVFLRAHSKAQLLAMLSVMEVDDGRARTLKKDELVAFVAEQAAARAWAPAYLSWTGGLAEAADEPPVEDEAAEAPPAA